MTAPDKIKHFWAGALVAAVALVLWLLVAVPVGANDPRGGVLCALISGVLQGLSKEASDWLKRRADQKAGVLVSTHPDPWDFVATASGAAFVAGVAWWWLW